MKIEENIEVCTLFDTYGAMLTEKQQQMIKDYYFYNTSLSEIAEMYGVSRQAVRDILNRSVQALYEYESKLNFVAKSNQIITRLTQLYNLANGTMQKQKIQRIIDEIKE